LVVLLSVKKMNSATPEVTATMVLPDVSVTVKVFDPMLRTINDWPVDTCGAGGNSKSHPVPVPDEVAVTSMMLLAGVPVMPLMGHCKTVFAVRDRD
jgi:hypothetical protein